MPLLTVPDERQSKAHNCGEAAVRCVLGFHAFAPDVLNKVRISSPRDGVDPLAVERFLSTLGLRTLAGSMSLADLRHYCDTGRPPIALIHRPGEDESHYVVVRGFSRGAVWFHDVDTGSQKASGAEWQAWWAAGDGRRGHLFPSWGIVAWPAA